MKILFILFSFITLTIISNAQTVIPQGDVSGTWTLGGSPYEIQGEITVPNGLTLTVEPGVLVEFQGHYKFNVQGRLLAVGTETDTIVFTINDTTGFHIPNVPDGGWHGIRFDSTSTVNDSSKIVYCKLQYGKAIGSLPDNLGGAINSYYFDKLTIANCLITNNSASGGVYPGGGGISLGVSNPNIIGNTISNNWGEGSGGGINLFESSPLIVDNLIVNNIAGSGGGISCVSNCNPQIINTTIENNTATNGDGGGIVCWHNNDPNLENVIFSQNSAFWAGGGLSSLNGNLQIDNCTFIENTAGDRGGAIRYYGDDSLAILLQINIANTSFESNTAVSGGGIYKGNYNSAMLNVFIDECQFLENSAERNGGLRLTGNGLNFTLTNTVFVGNEVQNFAGGFNTTSCIGSVSNCLFVSNDAAIGGGYFNSGGVSVWGGSMVDFMNCTFVDNSASYGAGLTVGPSSVVTTTNCIYWGNSQDQIALVTFNNEGGTLFVNHCDIEGGEDSVNVFDSLSTLIWGIGNIEDDPLFVNSSNGDYHLQDASPCIGAGIDSFDIGGTWYYCPITDIEGNPRPNPPGSMPDIGAYESDLDSPVTVRNDLSQIPDEYSLAQNYPNPFNPSTTIKYQIPELSFVTIKVYDVLGNEIGILVNEEKQTGTYEITWYAEQLPSGIYFYKLQAGSFIETKKMVLMK